MGQLCSAAKQVVTALVPTLLQQLKLNFTQEEWDSAHNSGTVEENNETLSGLGTNLKTASLLPTNLGKAAFICCNTYTRPDYSLGVGPMNDAITVATAMKEHGFTIYFAHNPTSTEFKKYFKHFIGNTKEYLLVYYTGHGASIDDTHGDEDDEKDEALVFDDAVFVSDDDLAEIIAGAGKPSSSKIVLLSDCCHSGSIYDLDNPHYSGKIPANIMSIAAARDSETAKQTTIGGADQGIFTFYFYKLLEETPTLTPTTMESKINSYIKKYEQCYTVHATTSSLLTTQIFK